MRWFLLTLLASGFWTTAALGLERGGREREFVRALERFDAAKSPADYRESAAILESLLADGYRNGAVFYNLGNAYFRAGEYGRAIRAYRKAQPYRPRDAYLEANLNQALAAAPGRLREPPPAWWTHVFFWSRWLSFPEKAYLLSGLSIAVAVAATWSVWSRRLAAGGSVALLLFLAGVVGIDLGLTNPTADEARRAVVIRETTVRKGIGQNYEPAFDQPLQDGAEFTILSESGEWILGRFHGIGDGWLRQEDVAR
jgi:tetratricopeptide (TPR) repeat protein